jgi:hypothetical protein
VDPADDREMRQIFSFHIPATSSTFLLETMDHNVGHPHRVQGRPDPARRHGSDHGGTPPLRTRAVEGDAGRRGDLSRVDRQRHTPGRLPAHRTPHVRVGGQVSGHRHAEDHSRTDWPMTQAELGDATWLSVVHVSQTLQ